MSEKETRCVASQEPITRSEQLPCALVTAFFGPVYIYNGFGANREYLLNYSNHSAEPTDLKRIFLYFECAHRRGGDSIFARKSALKCV